MARAAPTTDTVQRLWEAAVERHPDRPLAISDRDGSVFRYQDAELVVAAVARRLHEAGLRAGDRLVVHAAVHVEAAFAFWAAMRLGLVFVPVDPTWPRPRVERALAGLGPALVMVDGSCDLRWLGSDQVFLDVDRPPPPGVPLFSEWLGEPGSAAPPWPALGPDDEAAILFTSGTTAAPKGVVLTQGGLARSGRLVAETFGWTCADVLLSVGELHGMSGLRNPLVATLYAGASFVASSPQARADVFSIAACLERRGCTVLATAPALVRQLVDQAPRLGRLGSLRAVLTTASAIDGSTVRAFREVHGAPVHDYYGLTETTGICIAVPAGAEQIGAGTLGVPVGCEIRVVGEDGCPVGAGVVGELHVRGPNLMKGYLPGPTTGRVRVVDGWLHTGDLVRVREDGFVVLVGRCADFAKTRHGDLLHPGEVEDALERHPLVAEAGVCRYLAAAGEERLAAFVVPVAGARVEGRQLSRHVAEQLGERAVPGLVRVVPSLERDGSGEPDRDLLAGLLGREEES